MHEKQTEAFLLTFYYQISTGYMIAFFLLSLMTLTYIFFIQVLRIHMLCPLAPAYYAMWYIDCTFHIVVSQRREYDTIWHFTGSANMTVYWFVKNDWLYNRVGHSCTPCSVIWIVILCHSYVGNIAKHSFCERVSFHISAELWRKWPEVELC